MASNFNAKNNKFSILLVILILLCLVVVFIGPYKIIRTFKSWKADGYGADWLIVQYAQNGTVISYWELKGLSVGKEQSSDGIFFTDNDGNVVHLSGHYLFIQVQTNTWDTIRRKYVLDKLK